MTEWDAPGVKANRVSGLDWYQWVLVQTTQDRGDGKFDMATARTASRAGVAPADDAVASSHLFAAPEVAESRLFWAALNN